ncbi:MAG: CRTAC1 family protein [Rhodospirillaceae bacterium]|nr:CRTAC1 family protein [Rhodospirillaceae bacterium]
MNELQRGVAGPLLGSFVAVSCGGDGSGGGAPAPLPETAAPAPTVVTSRFTEVTASSGISFAVAFSHRPDDVFDVPHFSGGVASGDYDDDGDIDLFVVRGNVGPNLLYRNRGDNTFEDVASGAGLANTRSAFQNYRHSGPAFADMDGDGDLDLFIGGVQGDPSFVFRNNGDGTFTDVTAGSGIDRLRSQQNVSSAFGDYDLDGDVDLLLAHWGTPRSNSTPGDTEHLWRNDSTPDAIRFVSVSVEAGLSPSIQNLQDPRAMRSEIDATYAPSFAHLNDDRFPDIFMVADYNRSQVFINNGDGTFTNVTDVEVIMDTNGMGSALGDFDNDGDLDWFVTSIFRNILRTSPNGNRLYRNDGGTFVDVTATAGVADGGWGWATCFFDFENDGDLDLYHTNGWEFETHEGFDTDASRAFVSHGDGTFTNQASSLGLADEGQGRGVVCADFDSDGDVDIFLWSKDDENGGRLFRNDSTGNNFVTVKLNGLPPNTQAAGARIRATIGESTQLREIILGSNFISQNPADQIFGLGQAPQVDSLVVEWPDGEVTDFGIVQGNRRLVIDHPSL